LGEVFNEKSVGLSLQTQPGKNIFEDFAKPSLVLQTAMSRKTYLRHGVSPTHSGRLQRRREVGEGILLLALCLCGSTKKSRNKSGFYIGSNISKNN